ncbi:MAG: type II toxin-antitoxin system VapC family toxin [Chloroflexi bacterium]|nr:type II toxin-antitoxin system VapC family toxin [Chloroflexota bacterium]
MNGQVCVDASLALSLLLPEDLSDRAEAAWDSWVDAEIDIVTAPLFFAEVTSVLREKVHFGRISADEGQNAFDTFLDLAVRGTDPPELQRVAWRLAREYNRPRAYDAQYLAVASVLGCELWTADRRLVNAVSAPWVRWVGDYHSE